MKPIYEFSLIGSRDMAELEKAMDKISKDQWELSYFGQGTYINRNGDVIAGMVAMFKREVSPPIPYR